MTAALWNALGERVVRKILGENVLRVLREMSDRRPAPGAHASPHLR